MGVTAENVSKLQGRAKAPPKLPEGPPFERASQHSGLYKLAFALLVLLAFAIPFEDSVVIPGVGTIARLIGILAACVGVMAVLERRRIRPFGAGHVLLVLFVVWAAASYLWSVDPRETTLASLSYFQLLLMAWLIWELSSSDREQLLLMQAFVLGTYVSGADTLTRYLADRSSEYQRYAMVGFNPNDLALLMALSIPISYYLLIRANRYMAWVYRLQLIVAGTVILLTASRGALLAGCVALAIVPLTYRWLSPRQRVAGVFTAVVLVSSGVFFVPAASWERLGTIPNEFTEGTLNDRMLIWEVGLDVFRAHPFTGVGAGAFPESSRRALSEPLLTHNTFLSVLVEHGVIGFALLCTLLLVLVMSAWEMTPLARKLWLVTLAVWTVGVAGANWETRKPTWFLFALLMAQSASMLGRLPKNRNALRFAYD